MVKHLLVEIGVGTGYALPAEVNIAVVSRNLALLLRNDRLLDALHIVRIEEPNIMEGEIALGGGSDDLDPLLIGR